MGDWFDQQGFGANQGLPTGYRPDQGFGMNQDGIMANLQGPLLGQGGPTIFDQAGPPGSLGTMFPNGTDQGPYATDQGPNAWGGWKPPAPPPPHGGIFRNRVPQAQAPAQPSWRDWPVHPQMGRLSDIYGTMQQNGIGSLMPSITGTAPSYMPQGPLGRQAASLAQQQQGAQYVPQGPLGRQALSLYQQGQQQGPHDFGHGAIGQQLNSLYQANQPSAGGMMHVTAPDGEIRALSAADAQRAIALGARMA